MWIIKAVEGAAPDEVGFQCANDNKLCPEATELLMLWSLDFEQGVISVKGT